MGRDILGIVLPENHPRYYKYIILDLLSNINELKDSIEIMEEERDGIINHNEHLLTSIDILLEEKKQLEIESKNLQKTVDKLLEIIDGYKNDATDRGEVD